MNQITEQKPHENIKGGYVGLAEAYDQLQEDFQGAHDALSAIMMAARKYELDEAREEATAVILSWWHFHEIIEASEQAVVDIEMDHNREADCGLEECGICAGVKRIKDAAQKIRAKQASRPEIALQPATGVSVEP